MESVDPFDKHLDPPDYPEPEYHECDGCGETFAKDTLHKEGCQLICDECLRNDADEESERMHE